MKRKRKREIDLFIWDLDGTLVDSRHDLAFSVNAALKDMNLSALPQRQIWGFVGAGIHMLVQRCLEALEVPVQNGLLEKGVAQLRVEYGKHLLDRTQLMPHVRKALAHFSEKRMAIVTNKPEDFSRKILEGLGISHYFGLVLGGETLKQKKPHPAPLKFAMKHFGVPRQRTVMVGDSPTDILAGRAAGVWTCALANGLSSKKMLRAYQPHFIFSDIRAIVGRFV